MPAMFIKYPMIDSFKQTVEQGKKLAGLYIDGLRLSVAETLTQLFSAIALTAMVFLLGIIVLVFITVGIGALLTEYMAPFWAYLIVAGFFVLVIILLVAFKKVVFVDPIARFISGLIVNPPSSPADNENTENTESDEHAAQ